MQRLCLFTSLGVQARLEDHRRAQALQLAAQSDKAAMQASIRTELHARLRGAATLPAIFAALRIDVEGGRSASAQQLNAAYKRAMLRFHPDRQAQASLADQARSSPGFLCRLHEAVNCASMFSPVEVDRFLNSI